MSPERKSSVANQSAADRSPAGSDGPLIPPDAWLRLQASLRLSEREVQIVQQALEDQKEESIAYHLGISPHTVNTYFQRLYAKLHVASRAQLIVRVLAERILLLTSHSDDSHAD